MEKPDPLICHRCGMPFDPVTGANVAAVIIEDLADRDKALCRSCWNWVEAQRGR